jgi:hypothetical protein
LSLDLTAIWALCATMLVVTLYGAGLRRPFGSLPRIPEVPYWLWHLRWWVLIADCLFALFSAIMLYVLWQRIGIVAFAAVFILGYVAGDSLSLRIRLVPSFFVSLALAAAAVVLVAYSTF